MRPCLEFVLLVVLMLGGAGEAASQSSRRIIDMHLHAFPASWTAEHTPFSAATARPSHATTGAQLLPLTLEELDRHNVVLALLSGPLESVRAWMTAAPKRFIGAPQFPMTYLSIDTVMRLVPYNVQIEELHERHRSGQIGALGEITAQYAGLSPSDSAFEAFFALAEELDLPVGLHTGTGPPLAVQRGYAGHRLTLGNPILLEEVLIRHPALRVYLMHAGYPYLQETIAILRMFPQVYVDVAGINWRLPRHAFHQYVHELVIAGFQKRLMFGSDSEAWPEAVGLAVDAIESADFLSDEQKEDVFYNNAARFLRLRDGT